MHDDLEPPPVTSERLSARGGRMREPLGHTVGGGASAPAPPSPPICAQCHGAGFVRADAWPGHPEFGCIFPCACQTEALNARRRLHYAAYSDLARYADLTFDAFDERAAPSLPAVARAVRNYAAAPRGWLVLTGKPGVGKTHLAAAIAHACVAEGRQTFFLLLDRLLDRLRAAYAPDSELRADEVATLFIEADLVVLDDLRNSLVRPWARDQLFHLLDQRYVLGAPTVITTNLPASALEGATSRSGGARHGVEAYGELLDDRLRSRLLDRALVRWIALATPDYRRTRGKTT